MNGMKITRANKGQVQKDVFVRSPPVPFELQHLSDKMDTRPLMAADQQSVLVQLQHGQHLVLDSISVTIRITQSTLLTW